MSDNVRTVLLLLRIKPEWNVKIKSADIDIVTPYIRIKPEWNVNTASQNIRTFRGYA